MNEYTEIARAWIQLQSLAQDSPDAQALKWSSNAFNRLVIRDANAGWALAEEVLLASGDEWVLENLGSGPIETLLSVHPDETIKRIERDIAGNERLRTAISHIWTEAMSEGIRLRLQRLMRP